jgi:hypothetical protein
MKYGGQKPFQTDGQTPVSYRGDPGSAVANSLVMFVVDKMTLRQGCIFPVSDVQGG